MCVVDCDSRLRKFFIQQFAENIFVNAREVVVLPLGKGNRAFRKDKLYLAF